MSFRVIQFASKTKFWNNEPLDLNVSWIPGVKRKRRTSHPSIHIHTHTHLYMYVHILNANRSTKSHFCCRLQKYFFVPHPGAPMNTCDYTFWWCKYFLPCLNKAHKCTYLDEMLLCFFLFFKKLQLYVLSVIISCHRWANV